MSTATISISNLKKSSRLDGDGSVQVKMDPSAKIGNARVFAVYGNAIKM